MTHEEFWNLYENGEIQVKFFTYENPEADNGELALGEVDAYQYNGKFYLRISQNTAPKGYRRRYRNGGWSWATIKEFPTAAAANAYFKKAFPLYKKAKI